MTTSKGNSSRGRKVALIIGNDKYNGAENKLNHSANNAKAISNALKTIGFEVKIYDNLGIEMKEIVKDFAEKQNKDVDLVLFYFSGHGCQANEKNYLIPVEDAGIETDKITIESEDDIEENACSVERTLDRFTDNNPSYVTIFILDCCRPYTLKNASIPTGKVECKGLLEIPPRPGVFIQFACAANQTFSDVRDIGRNCLFAKHLLNNITESNVNVVDIFRGIVGDVYRESKLTQRPLSINGLPGTGQVYLKKVIQNFDAKTATSKTGLGPTQKLALIIGNDNYNEPYNRLHHSVNNANDLNDVLKKIGFNVTLHTNPETQMMKLIRNFAKTINDGDLILFYFSGHGYQLNGKNYLIPVYDIIIQNVKDVEEFAIDIEKIVMLLTERNPSYVSVLILDCGRPYKLKNASTSNAKGLLEIPPRPGVFIQFACAANQTVSGVGDTGHNCLFAKHLLSNIAEENVHIAEVFRRISDSVYLKSEHEQKPLSINGLDRYNEVYLNEVISVIPDISHSAEWKSHAQTVAGGFGPDSTFNKLNCPKGLYVDRNQSIFVADSGHHRIMKYAPGATFGRNITGKNIPGYGSDKLWGSSNVVFDRLSKSLIISDYHNRRVLRWFRKKYLEVLIKNVLCGGLTTDDEGSVYVSDIERHEVRRYRTGDRHGTVVAGGHGQGNRLSQLNHPTYIAVGPDEGVYVSDAWNDRVVKWSKGATEGTIVAGGKGKEKDRTQLDYPTGLIVDQLGTVYVSDHRNNRVMRFYKGASHGEIIAGGKYVAGDSARQLNGPEGLSFDLYSNLYVADSNNHRIQLFTIGKRKNIG